MSAALEAGRVIEIEEDPTIADGCAGNIEPGSMTFPIIQRLDGIILVRDEAIRNRLAEVAREEHLMIEGSAAVSIAALDDDRLEGKRVAAIVSGRNISIELFGEVIRSNG
jgi:threonine dehydratase